MSNFNEIFRKDLPYDNFKSTKKQGFTLYLEDTIFGKPQGRGGGQIDPFSRFRVKSNAKITIFYCFC